MKTIISGESKNILLSIDEAKTLYSCAVESNPFLEDWEYEIKIGVSMVEALDIQADLKRAIIESGEWGKTKGAG